MERQVRVATRDALMARDGNRRLTEEVLLLRRGRGFGVWIDEDEGGGSRTGGPSSPPPPPPLPLPLEVEDNAKVRRLLAEDFGRLHAQLSQALEVIWLCVGRENVESALSEEGVRKTLVEFQSVRDRSCERRNSFVGVTIGKEEIMRKAIAGERKDLERAMSVLKILK